MTSTTNALDITKKLISYPTITPLELNIYEYIKGLLPDFEALHIDKDGVKNLFLYKIPTHLESKSFNRDILHLCFAGHIDVVPPGGEWNEHSNKALNNKNNANHWRFNPFTPTISDGYLYGRGAQDMKSGVACFISAIKEFLTKDNKQDFIISILLTSDEEGEAIHGSKYALEILKSKNLMPTHCIVAEPTSNNIAGDIIKVGRRGSINGKIYISGKQGHVAYPSKCINPIELLGDRLGKLAGVNLDSGTKEFEPSKLVITDIRAGIETVNVTPNDMRIMFNVRNSTKTSLDSLRSYIEGVLSGLPYTLELRQSAQGFLTTDKKFIDILESSILDSNKFDVIDVTRSTSGGTSDARFFSAHGIGVAEIGVCNDRIHAINERVKLKDIERLNIIFFNVLCNFGKIIH
ncbi:succinyl-diaminopimelate desuccinylase [Helicobacter muridarum]|uniref:Succinyl-diaminopimelate desuccinylase n=1 Tax=Helicobacter muridarum TaxID=216 RepID=A0A099TVN2_9HELI|nr:succinyl-diaminopimelate desuccinylase [Helicobacter muridarum]TLE01621.1 succinyl-diaminopimelate desuccinylase [Helicobacter muridarum]STQ86238.1 succinyl-diaminopimelate desuccinylase [Helicobacter muridarum]